MPHTPAAIRAYLDSRDIPYRHLAHEPTPTSEDSARVRGEPLSHGAKALLLKLDDRFALFVLSAAAKLDSAAVKKLHRARSLRFATRAELSELTGLAPGAVPPFGEPILPFPLYLDRSVPELPRVAFNCGSLTESMIMQTADYLRAAAPAAIQPIAAT